MKTLIVCALLISFTVSFKLFRTPTQNFPERFTATLGCTDDRVKIVNDSIAQCEPLGVGLASQCIKNYMSNHSNG